MYPYFDHPFILHLIGGFLRFILLFGGAFFLLWYYLKHTKEKVQPAVFPEDQKIILPLKLQAYERFVLLLERIHPANLVMRVNSSELTSIQLQSKLVRSIREEFEYNLSQQLYISEASWEMIKNAKEETIALINQASGKVSENAHSSELVKAIFNLSIARGKLPVENALGAIKRELQESKSFA